jgi:membrane protease YdiL (CAAX protease family)
MAGGMAPSGFLNIAMGLVGSLLLVAVSLLAARLSGLQPADIGLEPDRWSTWRLICGIAAGVVLVGVYALIIALIANISWARSGTVGTNAIALGLLGALALASLEEIIFRGFALRSLMRSYGLWPAQFMIAAAFAAWHVMQGWPWMIAVVGTALGSILFGIAAVATRGLAVPIGLHGAWNFGNWFIGRRELPAALEIVRIDRERAALANWVGFTVVAVIGIYVFWRLHQRSLEHAVRTPDGPQDAIIT